MDIGKSFSYMFDDKEWLQKIAIGGLLTLVPIVQFLPVGYSIRNLKNASEGKNTLPAWDDWGGDFLRGLLFFVATLIYSIPLMIASGIMGVGSSIFQDTGDFGPFWACFIGGYCIVFLLGLAVAFLLPAGQYYYARTGDFGEFFRFGKLFKFISTNFSNYIVAFLLAIVASIAASLVGTIACVIGLIFTTFWATLVTTNLLGQVKVEPIAATASPFGPSEPATVSYGELTLEQPKTEETTDDDKPAPQA